MGLKAGGRNSDDLGPAYEVNGFDFDGAGIDPVEQVIQLYEVRTGDAAEYWFHYGPVPVVYEESFWGQITGNANAPVYDFNGFCASEVNGVLGVAGGTWVRVFIADPAGEATYAFEYDPVGMEILDSFDFIEVWPALVIEASASPLHARIWIPGNGFPPATGDNWHLTAAAATEHVAYDQVGEGTFADGQLLPCLKDYNPGVVEDWIQVRCQQGNFTLPNAATPIPPDGHINTFFGPMVDVPLPFTLSFEYWVSDHWIRLTSTRTVNAAAGFEITLQGPGGDFGCYSVRNKTWSVTLGACPPTGTTMRLRYIPVSDCAWSWVETPQTVEGADQYCGSTLGEGWLVVVDADHGRKLQHASPRPCAYEGATNNCAIYVDECGHIMGWYVFDDPNYVWYSPWGREEPS